MDEDHGKGEGRGALEALIELERRIEADLESARAEALRVVEAARRESESQLTRCHDELAEALARAGESIGRDCEASVREIVESSERTLQGYRRIDEPALRRLAEWVAAAVAEGRSTS
jgi:F0F1-type ATP synthase membrane subunit b/b'